MRLTRIALTMLALAAFAAPALAQATLSLPRPSQNASVSQTIGTTTLSLKYSRPGVKGRAIWGGLVPWDQPWRTGANEATQFTCSDDISVEGQPLPAGTYAVVTVPTAKQWTVVFSRQKDMWGANGYDPKQDQLRVTVKPVAAEHTEWMLFTIDPTSANEAELALRWEKLRVPVRLTVDVNAKVLANCRAAVAAAAADDWQTRYRAANWCLENNQALGDAVGWATKALELKENFQTLSTAAKASAKTGDTAKAIERMTKAVELGKADKNLVPAQIEPMEKLLAEWSAKK
jgi:hypothetical protein